MEILKTGSFLVALILFGAVAALSVDAAEAQSSSQAQRCDVLNRWSSRRIEKINGSVVRTDEFQYVLALDTGANATACLRFEIASACDSPEKADRVLVKFSAVQGNGLYRENAIYQLNGVCKESADVRLVSTPSGPQFEKIRRLEITSDWQEAKLDR